MCCEIVYTSRISKDLLHEIEGSVETFGKFIDINVNQNEEENASIPHNCKSVLFLDLVIKVSSSVC